MQDDLPLYKRAFLVVIQRKSQTVVSRVVFQEYAQLSLPLCNVFYRFCLYFLMAHPAVMLSHNIETDVIMVKHAVQL